MPERQASIVAQTPPLPSKRTRFKSEANTPKQNLPLTPKSKTELKSRKVSRPLLSKSVNTRRESFLSRSRVTKTLVFPTENLETIPIRTLNNSEPIVGVGNTSKNTKLQPQQSSCADLDDEPILPTINVDIRNPIDKILEEEPLHSSPKLNFRFPGSESLSSSFIMVSPSKMNISKPSMCHEQNGVEQKASPLVPQRRNYKRRQKEAQQCPRLTRASSLNVPDTESLSQTKRSCILEPPTSNVPRNTPPPQKTPVLLIPPHISLPSPKLDETSTMPVIAQIHSLLSTELEHPEVPTLSFKNKDNGNGISPFPTPTSLGLNLNSTDLNGKSNGSQNDLLENSNNTVKAPLDNKDIVKEKEELPLYKPGKKSKKDPISLLPSKPSCDKLSSIPNNLLQNGCKKDPHSNKTHDMMNGHVELAPEGIVIEAMKYSKKMGVRKCSNKFNIPINTIKKWIKDQSIEKKEFESGTKANKNVKLNGLHQTKVGSTDSIKPVKNKTLPRNPKQNKLNKQDKKIIIGNGKASHLTELIDTDQSLEPKYEFDSDIEWCNILEVCEPGTGTDEDNESSLENNNKEINSLKQPVNDDFSKPTKIQHQIGKSAEKQLKLGVTKSRMKKDKKDIASKKELITIKEELFESSDKNICPTVAPTKSKKCKKPQKKTNKSKKIEKSDGKNSVKEDSKEEENNFLINSVAANSIQTKPSKQSKIGKSPPKIKEKWQSLKAMSRLHTLPASEIKDVDDKNQIEDEDDKNQIEFKTAIESNEQIIPSTKTRKKPKNAKSCDPLIGIEIDCSSNVGGKPKPTRGRPRKKRSSDESMNATIEAVVKDSLLKYEKSLIQSQKETCKEIDLADLPLSQVHKLRKELKRSIFIQKKKEQYKELFKKKKMNGTLKLKAKNTRIIMARSFKKWKDFKLKKQKDHKEKKASITSKRHKNGIADTCGNKHHVKKIKPPIVTIEEQLATKPSPQPFHHNPLDQQSYNYYDSDIARPSRNVVRPVRYLDFMKQNTENMTIMRLHQDEGKSFLPYHMEMLDWNKDHSANTQAIYCYCGESGSWHTKMVRCSRCDQWFHERCLAPRPFSMPIISGDPFWLFVCSMCNIGSECLKRMDITWLDLVHLALFDLTSKTNRKFHDFDNDLMPFIEKNWSLFQLYKHFNSLTYVEKISKTKETLFSSETFEKGSETGQEYGLWGLRHYFPPPRPIYKVPDVGIISERTVLDEASISSTILPEPDLFLSTFNNFNIIYNEYVKPVVPEKPKKSKIKKKLKIKKLTKVNGCSSQVISRKNIQSLKKKSCNVKFKCLKLPEELKELLTENYESKIEVKKPLPYEISKSLHERGYPKVAMKFAAIIPPKKAIVVEALKPEQQKSKKKRGPKSKKSLNIDIPGSEEEKDSSLDSSESKVLDSLIPVKLDYYGENNPFKLGSIEEQRAARNLICNRKLKEEDLTKCRSRIRKRKHHLFIEESRKLWKSNEAVPEEVSTRGQTKSISEANRDLQYAGKYTTPSGEIKFLLLNPEEAEEESQMLDRV